MRPSISLVVPALNEAGTIGGVVRAAVSSELFLEIIVVDDGSDDYTATLADKAGADVTILLKNYGKGFAMREGCLKAQGDLIMYWDADLNQTTDSFRKLLELINDYDLVVGFLPELSQSMFKQWSGQKLLKKSLMVSFLEDNPDIAGYAIDGSLIKWAMDRKLKIAYVELTGIRHVRKFAKQGMWVGLYQYLRMYWQIWRRK